MSFGASFLTSLSNRSPNPAKRTKLSETRSRGQILSNQSYKKTLPSPLNRVEPPESTMFEYRIRLRSMSDF